MTAEAYTHDGSLEVRLDLTGHVRTLVEQFAACPFEGDEDAEAALDRFSTRVAVRSTEEAEAVKEQIKMVEEEKNLKTNQRSALRSAKAELEEAKAHFRAEDTEETPEVVTDGGRDLYDADDYELADVGSKDSFLVYKENNDGSRSSFRLAEGKDVEVVRTGRDSTVMLRHVFGDGSSNAFLVPTEFYNEIRDQIAHLVDDPEFEEDEDEDDEEIMTEGGTDVEEDGDEVDPAEYDALDGISSRDRMNDEVIGRKVSASYNTSRHVYSVYGVVTHPYTVREGDDVLVEYAERTASGGFSYRAYQQSVLGTIAYRDTTGFTIDVADGDDTAVVRFPDEGEGGENCRVVFPSRDEEYALKSVVKVEQARGRFATPEYLATGDTGPLPVSLRSESSHPVDCYTSCDRCGRDGYAAETALDQAADVAGRRGFERPVICKRCDAERDVGIER